MNSLLLFFIFLLAGLTAMAVTYIALKPISLINKRWGIFLYDFLYTLFMCLVFHICTKVLNFGIFRLYFAISYIIGIVLCSKLILQPLEKVCLMFYNNIKQRRCSKKCNKKQN